MCSPSSCLEVFKSSGLERARWTLTTYRSFLEKNKKFVRWIDRAVKGNIVQRDLVPTNSVRVYSA